MRSQRAVPALVVATTIAVLGLAVVGPAASADPQDVPRAQLAAVRAAMARYHDVDEAVADGYELLDVCFDSAAGGMGYHYLKGVDASLDPLAPEALVYEPSEHGLRLVGVEYIVPLGLSNSPPEVLDQSLHANPGLGLWVLHAWIWQPNPAGMFADFNPNVADCP
ncbi:MAG TPA: hypothetical protein VFV32_13690 [Acidimicrobiales bacterium]|nr:hypothetical protein [Acidimicrobiales bacterium]